MQLEEAVRELEARSAEMPHAHQPLGFGLELYPFQCQSLEWMMKHEGAPPPVPIGILASDTGMGKTIIMCALMASRPCHTLIVVPTSIVLQWEGEIRRCFGAATPSIFVYWGPHRKSHGRYPRQLGEARIVITTYQTLMADTRCRATRNSRMTAWEADPGAFGIEDQQELSILSTFRDMDVSPLQETHFDRVIFDEAHRCPSRRMPICGQAMTWAIAGEITPRLLCFMDCNIDALLTVSVRHTRSEVTLPSITEISMYIPLTSLEKQVHDTLFPKGLYTLQVSQFLSHPSALNWKGCDLPTIDVSDLAGFPSEPMECPISLERMQVGGDSPPVRLPCQHFVCATCVVRIQSCPMCRAPFVAGDLRLVVPNPAATWMNGSMRVLRETVMNSKICALYILLGELLARPDVTKVVVVTQWIPTLTNMQTCLSAAGMAHVVLSGHMTMPKREQSLRAFQAGAPRVMLASMGCTAVGLNLHNANQLVFMEPLCSGSVGNQARERVHRLGQMRPVTVITMTSSESAEETVELSPGQVRVLVS